MANQELAAHFYAMADETGQSARDLWERCGRLLGARHPIPATGLPAELPQRLDGPAGPVAALRDDARRVRAVARLERGIVVVSILLAHHPGHTWADFDRLLEAVAGKDPDLLGTARLYLGVVASDALADLSGTGRALKEILPATEDDTPWWHHGCPVSADTAAWEFGSIDDERVERQICVVSAESGQSFVSRWTWSEKGATHLPPFARYLMNVAKIRHQLRVRQSYPGVAEMCERIAHPGRDGEPAPDPRIAAIRTIRKLKTMRKAVQVSWENAVNAGDVPAGETGRDLFGRDRVLAARFAAQLADDTDYLNDYEEELGRMGAAGVVQPQPKIPSAAPGEPLRVLAVADEWFSQRGGISTLNRDLCAAVTAAGNEVFCLLPRATAEEQLDAKKRGVHLVPARTMPGFTDRELLMQKPDLPRDGSVDVVIGHGRVTGGVAQSLAASFYPDAVHVHLVHVSPEQTEWYKLDRTDDAGTRVEERSKIEVGLAGKATFCVPVGPELTTWMEREMHSIGAPAPLCLNPGFDGPARPTRGPAPGVPQILMLGRAEDESIKGIDIAAKAIGAAMSLSPSERRWELLIRGAPKGQTERLRTRVIKWIGHHNVDVQVKAYTSDRADIDTDLRRASLVVMPSRVEGFGLVGHEAILAGTPVLVSARSGLGILLAGTLDKTSAGRAAAARMVLPVTRDLKTDAPVWAARISSFLLDREATFATAAAVRDTMAAELPWSHVIEELLSGVRTRRAARTEPTAR